MDLAQYIDHTCLKPEAKIEDIVNLCTEAVNYSFAAVCVQPVYVALAANRLAGSDIKVATVVGFPLGSSVQAVKVLETKQAIDDKANEIDMVMNIAAAKNGQWRAVEEEIRQVVNAAAGNIVKVIIETALLTDEEKRRACEAVILAGAHYVKTSTGFAKTGATEEDIRLIRQVVGDSVKIKASGGIRTKQQAQAMIAAGAVRLGTSAGIAIVSHT